MPAKPDATAEEGGDHPLLTAEDLSVLPGLRRRALARIGTRPERSGEAVRAASLTLAAGEALALVGEPGSGNLVLARALVGRRRAAGGTVRHRGSDLAALTGRRRRPLRRALQTLSLGPEPSLDPAQTVRAAVGGPLSEHRTAPDEEHDDARTALALERAGLPADCLDRPLSDLSEQDRRRAELARAIVVEPELLVVEEQPGPHAAGARDEVLARLRGLRESTGLACVLVTGDLAGAGRSCDTVAVMHLGRVVEYGPAERVCAEPLHPCTRALLAEGGDGPPRPTAAAPDRGEPAPGCAFRPRCPAPLGHCGWEPRDLAALLQRRRAQLDPARRRAERALIAGADAVGPPGAGRLVLTPGRRSSAEELLAHLRGLREEDSAADPREPLWGGVVTMSPDGDRVVVEFVEAVTPVLAPAGEPGRRVACHLAAGAAD
ncbi:ATP-binding cassette domain-containing protein [Streptomyces thermolineatus]|uniref:ATP-binding cassette domain-containing protein n=1 Tax=Streptomyces thermolineatus TaxID=44033 RepID=UPI00384AFA2B